MKIQQPLENLLSQLHETLNELSMDQYTQPVDVLSGATIGQHTRHVLEFFIELNVGYNNGVVDYDRRKRNHTIESDNRIAAKQLQLILAGIVKPDKHLILNTDYGIDGTGCKIKTNYYRELAYNLEHTVHHMALIRIGVSSVSSLQLPAEFGVASSTLKFRAACAQ